MTATVTAAAMGLSSSGADVATIAQCVVGRLASRWGRRVGRGSARGVLRGPGAVDLVHPTLSVADVGPDGGGGGGWDGVGCRCVHAAILPTIPRQTLPSTGINEGEPAHMATIL